MTNDILFVLLFIYGCGIVGSAVALIISLVCWKGEIGPFWGTAGIVLVCIFFWPVPLAGMAYWSVVKLWNKRFSKCTCSDKEWIACEYCQDNN